MSEKLIEWSAGDYSPTYIFTVDGNGEYVRLEKVLNIPSGWPQSKEIEITQEYIDYMANRGFDKYKDYIKSFKKYEPIGSKGE